MPVLLSSSPQIRTNNDASVITLSVDSFIYLPDLLMFVATMARSNASSKVQTSSEYFEVEVKIQKRYGSVWRDGAA